MTGSPDDRGERPPSAIDAATVQACASALGIPVPSDRMPAVLDGARRLDAAARLLRDALHGMADRDRR